MGIAPLCCAYIFWPSALERSEQLKLLEDTLQAEFSKIFKLYNIEIDELSYSISNSYDPRSYLGKADLSSSHYKKISVFSYSTNEEKRFFYSEIIELIFSKLYKLKLVNCYCLNRLGDETRLFLFFKMRSFKPKLVATETYAKLYTLAMYSLLDTLSPNWEKFLKNIKDDEETKSYNTSTEIDNLFNQAQKELLFKTILIKK